MDSLLAELRQDGRLEAGIGHFTIDLMRRSQKLFSVQVHHPQLFLLKLIQMAVAAGAPSISVTLNAQFVGLEFGSDQLQAEALHQRLNGQGSKAARWMEHAEMGLMLAMVAPGLGFTFRLSDPGASCVIRGNRLELEAGRGSSARVEFQFKRPHFRWWRPGLRKHDDLTWKNVMRQRCQLCPVPLHLNADLINRGMLEESLRSEAPGPFCWLINSLEFGAGPRFALAPPIVRPSALLQDDIEIRYVDQQPKVTPLPRTVLTVWPEGKARLRSLGYFPGEGAWSRAAQWLTSKKLLLLGWWTIPDLHCLAINEIEDSMLCPGLFYPSSSPLPQPALALSRLAALAILPEGHSYLIPILDGITLDPLIVPLTPPGSQVVVASEDWTTDLGQLKVVQNDYFQKESQSAQVLLAQLTHNAAALLDLPDQYAGLTDSVRSRWRNAIARFA